MGNDIRRQAASVDALLARSSCLIDEAKARFKRLQKNEKSRGAATFLIDRDTNGDYIAIRREDALFDPDLHMAASEAIHHLNCALDHLAFSLDESSTVASERIFFQLDFASLGIESSLRNFRKDVLENHAELNEILNGLEKNVEELLAIHLLRKADNWLKHRTIFTIESRMHAPLAVADASSQYAFRRDIDEVKEGRILARGSSEDEVFLQLSYVLIDMGFSEDFIAESKSRHAAVSLPYRNKSPIELLDQWHTLVSRIAADWMGKLLPSS